VKQVIRRRREEHVLNDDTHDEQQRRCHDDHSNAPPWAASNQNPRHDSSRDGRIQQERGRPDYQSRRRHAKCRVRPQYETEPEYKPDDRAEPQTADLKTALLSPLPDSARYLRSTTLSFYPAHHITMARAAA
jgi:hypothetical protein